MTIEYPGAGRRGIASQRHGHLAQKAASPLPDEIRKTSGKVIGFSGIKGDSEKQTRGGVWLNILLSDGREAEIWCGDSISTIYGEIGVGNMVGKTVRCSYRGDGIDDLKRGVCNFIGSGKETYEHPDYNSPISVGGFHGCTLDSASHRVFAGPSLDITGEI